MNNQMDELVNQIATEITLKNFNVRKTVKYCKRQFAN